MNKMKKIMTLLTAFGLMIILTGVISQSASAKTAAASNMAGNCEPYHLQNATVTENFAMGGEDYSGGILYAMGFNGSEDGYTGRADFTLDSRYTRLSFTAGCIAGNKDASITILADSKQILEQVISCTAMPQEITVDVTDVQQLSIILYCENYSANYNMAIYGMGGISFVSNGTLKAISLNEEKVTLTASAPQAQLYTSYVPSDVAEPDLVWSSSDTSIATVDEKGVVTGLYGGTAVITAATEDGSISAACEVTVDMPKDISGAKITLSENNYIYSGNANTPKVEVTYDGVALEENEDYIILIKDNTEVGTGTVTVKGINKYSNSVVNEITIAPQAPVVSAITNTATGIKVQWAQVTGAKGYYIYRKQGSGGSYSMIKDITKATTVSYTDTTVTETSTKKYYYVVYAYSDSLVSAASTENSLYRILGTTATTITNSNTGIKVQWTKVDGVTGYIIYRKAGTGEWEQVKKIKKNTTVSYNDTTSKTNGTVYKYKVYTYKGTSLSVASTTLKMYSQSRLTLLKLSNSSAGKVTMTWSAGSGCSGYEVEYATNSSFTGSTVKTIKTTTKLSGLTKGKTYYVRIRSYKTVSGVKYYSAWSAKKSVKIKK